MSFLERMAFELAEEDFSKTTYKVDWTARGLGMAFYSGTETVQAVDKQEAKAITTRRIKNRSGSDLYVQIVKVEE